MDRYNSVNNTKNDFRIAFWKLYQRNPVEKISVSELCRVAGYNRTTFYVYYDNIHDLLSRCIDEMIRPLEEHAGELQHIEAPENNEVIGRLYMTILKANEKRIRLLIEHHQLYILEEKVKEIIKPVLYKMYRGESTPDSYFDYMLEYQMAAVFGVIAKWFDAQDLTEQEIVELLIDCSQCGIAHLFHKNIATGQEESAKDERLLDQIITKLEVQKEE